MDPLTLYISYLMEAKVMGEYELVEFENLYKALKLNSIDDLK